MRSICAIQWDQEVPRLSGLQITIILDISTSWILSHPKDKLRMHVFIFGSKALKFLLYIRMIRDIIQSPAEIISSIIVFPTVARTQIIAEEYAHENLM